MEDKSQRSIRLFNTYFVLMLLLWGILFTVSTIYMIRTAGQTISSVSVDILTIKTNGNTENLQETAGKIIADAVQEEKLTIQVLFGINFFTGVLLMLFYKGRMRSLIIENTELKEKNASPS